MRLAPILLVMACALAGCGQSLPNLSGPRTAMDAATLVRRGMTLAEAEAAVGYSGTPDPMNAEVYRWPTAHGSLRVRFQSGRATDVTAE